MTLSEPPLQWAGRMCDRRSRGRWRRQKQCGPHVAHECWWKRDWCPSTCDWRWL